MHFFSGFFQLGYVTNDLDSAMADYRARFGPIEFAVNTPGLINGRPSPTRRLALAWIDEVMTEIIEPDPLQQTIYDQTYPEAPGAIRLHHFGYLIDDYPAMLKTIAGMGCDVPLHGSIPGALDYIYADTREMLGHYCEFIRLEDGGRAYFDSVPRLRTR